MESSDLIIELLKEQKENQKEQIKSLHSVMDAGFDTLASELRDVKKAKVEQNGRVDKLEKTTQLLKIIARNPVKTLLLFIVTGYGFNMLAEAFTFKEILQLIKNIL
jgi:phosphosulfolactate synthase (CoM biosynthesis protein A)